MSTASNTARLLISCSDRPGIVAAVTQFLFENGANVVDSNQHTTDPETGLFFMRLAFVLPDLEGRLPGLTADFRAISERFGMDFRFEPTTRPKRVAVFVSHEEHCLLELFWQWKRQALGGDFVLVVGNHAQLAEVVQPLGVPFHHLPVSADTRAQSEAAQRALLDAHHVDVVVLARYMQILSADFVRAYPNRIINIHHSFLPAFVGSNPYAQAYERGVKLIGATAHYVTPELDAGPIIEQDVHRVGHRDELEDLKRMGRQVERMVLARAVRWHLDDRVLVHGNKTVVFT